MEPAEFTAMVKDIREAEKALGRVSYELTESEQESRKVRKSIFVSADIKKGDIFTNDNIRVVRPAYGMHPRYFEDIMGKRAAIDIAFGTPLSEEMIEDFT